MRPGGGSEEEGDPVALPVPESDDLGRYLEDTITIDWQTPAVSEAALALVDGASTAEQRLHRLFGFVRDEVEEAFAVGAARIPCRASEVLRDRVATSHGRSHLLAALLRHAGFPTGFCYARLVSEEAGGRPAPQAFNGVYWKPADRWILLDASRTRDGVARACRFEAPFDLPGPPDPERGEGFLPWILRRPPRALLELLERAPDLTSLGRHLPGVL